jgi:excisionase family DNA binding protein
MAVWESTYLTVEEVAQKLRISTRTVRRWAAAGAISALRVGRQWRIPADALEQLAHPVSSEANGDWLEACRRARQRTTKGMDSTPLLRTIRQDRSQP